MKDVITKVFSFNGLSLLIGVIGGLFGIISIFINWNAEVSVKWLAALTVISLFAILILVKIIIDSTHKLKTFSSGKFKVKSIAPMANEVILITENSQIIANSHTSISVGAFAID